MEHLSLHEPIVFLVAAGLVVPLFKALKVSPILGFIVVGLFVGPYGIAALLPDAVWVDLILITDQDGVSALAELGIIFLLFTIGLDLSLDRLWAMRRLVLGMGNVQILVTALVVGAIAYAWGNSLEAAIILGGCLALSSTAIVLQILIDQGRFSSPAGHASFSILLAQDLAVVPLLFLVASFADTGATSTAAEFALGVATALLTLTVIFVAGRLVLRPLFRFVGQLNSPELFMATTLLVVIATAATTHAVGLSAALGAFLAGLLLAESEYRHDIEMYIEPFKGLLLGLFFMSVSMQVNLAEVANEPLWIFLSAVGLCVIKSLLTSATARSFGYTWKDATEAGILLAQGGEFAFVVIGLALSFALLPETTAQFMLLVVSATMFATPLLAVLSRRVGERNRDAADSPDQPFADDITDHVIVVGFGRTGRLLSSMLNQHMIPFVAIDRNPDIAADSDHTTIHMGDATRGQVLQKFHINRARALVVCINQPETVSHILQAVRLQHPDLPVLVRARDERQANDLLQAGATVAVPEVLESGLQLADALLQQMDMSEHAASEIVAEIRRAALAR